MIKWGCAENVACDHLIMKQCITGKPEYFEWFSHKVGNLHFKVGNNNLNLNSMLNKFPFLISKAHQNCLKHDSRSRKVKKVEFSLKMVYLWIFDSL